MTPHAFQHGTAASWTAENAVLESNVIGIETDTGKMKIGNGVTPWADLAYLFVPIPAGLSLANGVLAPASGLVVPTSPPATAGAAGAKGAVTWDATHIYVCVDTNTWVRASLATW